MQKIETISYITIPVFHKNLYLGKYMCLRALLASTLIIRERNSPTSLN